MQLIDPHTCTQYRCAYDQAHLSPFLHNTRQHRIVLDGGEGYWRDCADRDQGVERVDTVEWSDIIYVDFKVYEHTEHSAQWRDLDRVLANGQNYHVLHIAADDRKSLRRPWLVDRLYKLKFVGTVYLDLVQRWHSLEWTQHRIQRQMLLGDLAPLLGRCQGVDYRSVDQQSGVALHEQVIHPRGRREFFINYDN